MLEVRDWENDDNQLHNFIASRNWGSAALETVLAARTRSSLYASTTKGAAVGWFNSETDCPRLSLPIDRCNGNGLLCNGRYGDGGPFFGEAYGADGEVVRAGRPSMG